MDDLKQHSKRLGYGRSQCIIAKHQGVWEGKGNGGAKCLPRIDDAKGRELISLLAVMYQNGRLTESEAKALLAKHGF